MSKGVELRLFLGLALLAATPSGASAQCLLCGASESAKTTAGRGGQTPLHVEVETQLDMGRVAAGSGGGEVAIDPVTGVRRVSGDVRDLGGFALTGVVTVRATSMRLQDLLDERMRAKDLRRGCHRTMVNLASASA